VVLSGASTVGQHRSNLAAIDVRLDDEAEVALAGIAEAPESYWSYRSRLAWN
jgi:aryl-alcohol dehydrogenase-like predicted oxidoreductase